MSSELYVCPTCHGHSNMTWHRLTPGLVQALVKVRKAVIKNEYNCVKLAEIGLSTTERMNFSKLRQHGLVAKYRLDGEVKRGYWVLTNRGASFLRGELAVPARVQTLNNHVVDHERDEVTITDVLGSVPQWEEFATIKREAVPLELTQAGLFS